MCACDKLISDLKRYQGNAKANPHSQIVGYIHNWMLPHKIITIMKIKYLSFIQALLWVWIHIWMWLIQWNDNEVFCFLQFSPTIFFAPMLNLAGVWLSPGKSSYPDEKYCGMCFDDTPFNNIYQRCCSTLQLAIVPLVLLTPHSIPYILSHLNGWWMGMKPIVALIVVVWQNETNACKYTIVLNLILRNGAVSAEFKCTHILSTLDMEITYLNIYIFH